MSLAIATLALAIDVAVLSLALPREAVLPAALIAAPVFVLLGHAEPRRGRRISTLVAAAVIGSLAIEVLVLAWPGLLASPIRVLAAGFVASWPGHLLACRPGAPALRPGPTLVNDRMARATKRAVDLVLGIALGALALPVIAGGALVVRATSPGPAFYSQMRVTRAGRLFRIWKLRTMARDAETGTPIWPEDNDPRITPAGRVLRLVWIDELPQIWNVIRGDMSLVGPRPERPEFVEAFAAELPTYHRRHAVCSGITGLAQVTGLIGDTSIRRRLALDLHYVRIWTPGLDASILARTALQAFRRALGRKPRVRPGRRAGQGMGGSILELRGVARHLPERDQ